MRRLALAALVALGLLSVPFVLPPSVPEGALPPRGRTIPLGGTLSLDVVEAGAGDPVVLVHGLPSCASDWAEVPERLAALGHRAIAYDRAGFGYSSRPDPDGDAYTMASSARDLAGLLDALGLPRATLVGWSYGGGVAQILATTSPERVAGVVLLGSVGPTVVTGGEQELPVERLLRGPFGPPLLRWVAAVPPVSRAVIRDSVSQAFAGSGRAPAGRVPAGWEARTRAVLALPDALRSYVLETRRFDPSILRPEAIRAPTLVLHGADDRLVPEAVARDLHARIPGSRLVVVPGGSHMLPATHADLVAREIDALVPGR